jgi:hypothetical protein
MTRPFTDAQIDRWRLLWDEANNDEAWLAKHQKRDARRVVVQQELLDLLNQFLSKEKSVEEVKNIFDQRTRSDWDAFGLKGTSGAMFLNKMVKHIPDTAELTEQLSLALRVPANEASGHRQMQAFFGYLQGLIDSGIRKALISPGYTPFLVSAWWHFQDVEQWPVFYVSGRKALEQSGSYADNLNFPLYIVTPKHRLDKVQRELSRPTFQMLELHKQCGFFSFEGLMAEAENIMRWASDPTAIDRLAQKVDDVNYEDSL